MHTTAQLLDALAAKLGGASDYRIGKLLQVSTPAVVTHWRKGRRALSIEYAHKIAALLEWDPAYVVACVEHERAARSAESGRDSLEETGEILATWERIAAAFKPAAAALACIMLACAGSQGASNAPTRVDFASALSDIGSDLFIHYAKYARRLRDRLAARFRRAWQTVFPPCAPLPARV